MERYLVVAIHDVAPSNADGVRWLLDALDRAQIRPRVLKVVPRWRDREELASQPALLDLLRNEVTRGSEVVVHGYTHTRRGPLVGPWPTRLRARLFAARDAEFTCYAADRAAAAATRAREELADLGLPARGFCAPGWLAGPGLDGALTSAGFDYAVTFAGITDLRHAKWTRAPAIGYMGADGPSEWLTTLENALTLRWPVRPRVLRVFLHPQGAATSAACAAVLGLLPRLRVGRELVTYRGLLS